MLPSLKVERNLSISPTLRRGEVYYVGVKSEDREASEYAFIPIFTATPFSELDQNGNEIVNGLLLPTPIPDGNNAHPGTTNVFALAINSMEVGERHRD